jgi:acid phosphatase type 7
MPATMFAAVALACLVAAPASAEERVFAPVADTYVSAAAKTSRFGSARTLRVGAHPRRRAYLRFAVSLPRGAMIRRAVLRLHPARHSRSVRLQANVARTTWSERRLRYRRLPPLGARLARWRGGRPGARYQAVSVRRARIRNAPNTIALTTTTSRLARFGSRESRHPPQLAITFSVPPVPVPDPAVHPPDCSDGVDDDGDGRLDLADPGCAAPTDASETYPVPTVVMAAGDIQPASATAVPTAALLTANRYDALLPLGDNQYEGGTLAEYNAYYSQSWGRPADKRRTFPVPGNHEIESGLAGNYCAYFRTGAALDPCPGGRPYYSFELGTWHVVALDSSSGTIGDTQIAWLRGDLATHRTACTLAFWHHPRYSPGGANPLNNVWAVLMAGGVDAALVAHDHNYQRYAPMNNMGAVDTSHGIRQFVVGTGGRSHETFTKPVTGREVMNVDTFGLLRLSLGRSDFSWRFLPVPGQTFQDSGAETCH